MHYTRDQFMRLLDAVDDQGGTHLDEVCEDRFIPEFAGPKKIPENLHVVKMCNESALVELPYDAAGTLAPEAGVVKVCAVDDCVGLWPRFKDQVYA